MAMFLAALFCSTSGEFFEEPPWVNDEGEPGEEVVKDGFVAAGAPAAVEDELVEDWDVVEDGLIGDVEVEADR
jgi:hypothetical protein